MPKYVVNFSKQGTICYISHLDLMRMFKRSFKRAGIKLAYSQGFNPHPKMSFAQPLSLGYAGLNEMIEFETAGEYDDETLLSKLREQMPEGVELADCGRADNGKKTLASKVVAAEYIIKLPLNRPVDMTADDMKRSYLGAEKIVTLKKQKKKKEPIEIDIRPMIREADFEVADDMITVRTVLDSGSVSNLSPELLIRTLKEMTGADLDRNEAEITRTRIYFAPKEKEGTL